ncbi:MAG TPA: DEAD/DEAH box helicase [Fulvivirga sp.]|nr:DEAD/DEAH box helicase [Fulvivirga sp.]
MSSTIKSQKEILDKLGFEALNPMQVEAQATILSNAEIVLLSPTGTGKTLAFLLPIIASLDPDCSEIQALILVPSRELAIQIEQVIREMGAGYKANAVYGGRSGSKDRLDIKHRPAILIGTPGRIADHIRRDNFSVTDITTLVLDEFDKSLEVGFEVEMSEIIGALPNIETKILTSATQRIDIPRFVGLQNPVYIDHLKDEVSQLKIKKVLSKSKDKLETLVETLSHIGNYPGIIFCNFKDSIERISEYLTENNIGHGCFHGGMEQRDREVELIKFRNGTHQLLIATDLAARGIDIPELKFILHYHLPNKKEEFTHRNGRTARMFAAGTAYVLHWEGDELPEFIQDVPIERLQKAPIPAASKWKTLFISGGRNDKISKGDIAGLILKQGKLDREDVGIIEIKLDFSFVAVKSSKVKTLLPLINNTRLKKKKVRVTVI